MRVKNRVIVGLVIVLCMFLSKYAISYSGNGYYIDIPETYKTQDENSFTDGFGNGINIDVKEYNDVIEYSEEELETIANALMDSMNANPDELKKSIQEANDALGTNMTEEEIDEYINALTFSITEKEVTTFTKNNYKCFHIKIKSLSKRYGAYMDQYLTLSGTKIYAVTIASMNEDEINSDEMQKVINSFTIKKEGINISDLIAFIIGLSAIILSVAVIIFVFLKIKKLIKSIK